MKNFLIKLNTLIAKLLPQDKLLHLIAGYLIGYVVLALLVLTGTMFYFPLFLCLSVFVTAIAGFAKEILDEKIGGTSDFMDAVATIVGSLINVGIVLLTRVLFV